MLSTGLESEAQAGAIFAAIKAAASSEDICSPITFEEFTRSIIDFPQLLEQFKEDLESLSPVKVNRQALSIQIDEMSESDTSACNSTRTRGKLVGVLTFESEAREDNNSDETNRLGDVIEMLGVAMKIDIRKDSAPEPDFLERERSTLDENCLSQRIEEYLTTLLSGVDDASEPIQSCED